MDVSYTSLYCSLFSSCDVLFGVFVLLLVCHGNWVRSFLITFFFFSFYPAIEPSLPGNMGWAQKTLMCLPKCRFLNLWRNGKKKIKKGRKKSHPILVMDTFCDFHQVCKVDISQMIRATAKAALQEGVLEETYRNHLPSPSPLQLFLGQP